MIRRAGLQRRPAGLAGSDGETNPELAFGLVSRSDSGQTRRFAAPAEWLACVRQLLIS